MARSLDQVVVATTVSPADQKLVDWCVRNGVHVFRGDEEDVLGRFFHCATEYNASHVVRLTGDCPLIDPQIIDDTVDLCLSDDAIDYASNVEPMTYPEGMNVEAMPFDTLKIAYTESNLTSHREHVTPYVRFHPEMFAHSVMKADPDLSHIRLTVDYPEDLTAISRLLEILLSKGFDWNFKLSDVLHVLDENSSISSMLAKKPRDLWRKDVAREEGRDDIA